VQSEILNRKYLVFDVELGGVDIQYSLLTTYFAVFNSKFQYLDSLDIALKSDPYIVSAQGLSVCKIDLVKHDKYAEPKSIVGGKLRNFLIKHSDEGRNKLIPIAHGIDGDLRHIWDKILNRLTFEQYVSYRKIDTSILTQMLQLKGSLPNDLSGSIESLKEYYRISDCGNLHEAKTDALLCIKILQKLLET
jgi:hypothetical protein